MRGSVRPDFRPAELGRAAALALVLPLTACLMPDSYGQDQPGYPPPPAYPQAPAYPQQQPAYPQAPAYPQQPPPGYGAPAPQEAYPQDSYPPQDNSYPQESNYPDGSAEQVSAPQPPPPLPDYDQPECPGPGYLWSPGYWGYNGDYYWVPGTWVLPPQPGVYWTPGWWGWGGNVYLFHAGYWGPHVGYYGGVNYGYGYSGHGYEGGRWDGGVFSYNRAVNRVSVIDVQRTYNVTVVNNVTVNRVSYNGGAGGLNERPTAQEQAWRNEQHFRPTAEQVQHQSSARGNQSFYAAQNHGRPPVAAMPRPGPSYGGGGQNFQRPQQQPVYNQPRQQEQRQPVYNQPRQQEQPQRPQSWQQQRPVQAQPQEPPRQYQPPPQQQRQPAPQQHGAPRPPREGERER